MNRTISMNRTIVLVAFMALASASPAQSPLTTSFSGGLTMPGQMFDVDCTAPLSITRFDVHLRPGWHTVEVYAKTTPGSYRGSQTNPSAWTRVGSFPGTISAGLGRPTPLPPLPTPVAMAPGAVQAFYVTTTSWEMRMNVGSSVGALHATSSDGFLNLYEGAAQFYRFSGNGAEAVFNGNIHYLPGPPGRPAWQVNQVGASLSFNGAQGTAFLPAKTRVPHWNPVSVSIRANGSPLAFNVATTFGDQGVPGGVLTTPGGQVVNINPASPSFDWFFGTQFIPYAATTLRISPPEGLNVQAQMAVIDPTAPSGIVLSQFCDHTTTSGVLPMQPINNGGVVVDIGATGATSSGGIEFYGVSYTQVTVTSNGRLMGGNSGNNDTISRIMQARGSFPFIGLWTDLDPSRGGTWTFGAPARDIVELTYTSVPTFSPSGPFLPGSSNSFTIRYDDRTKHFELDGLQGIRTANATIPTYLLGIAPAWVSTYMAPNLAFTPGTTGGVTQSDHGLYEFRGGGALRAPEAVTAGVNTITFFPDGLGNYVWSAY